MCNYPIMPRTSLWHTHVVYCCILGTVSTCLYSGCVELNLAVKPRTVQYKVVYNAQYTTLYRVLQSIIEVSTCLMTLTSCQWEQHQVHAPAPGLASSNNYRGAGKEKGRDGNVVSSPWKEGGRVSRLLHNQFACSG